jgi:hypothetical protein
MTCVIASTPVAAIFGTPPCPVGRYGSPPDIQGHSPANALPTFSPHYTGFPAMPMRTLRTVVMRHHHDDRLDALTRDDALARDGALACDDDALRYFPCYDPATGTLYLALVDRDALPVDGDIIVCEDRRENEYTCDLYRIALPLPEHIRFKGVRQGIYIPDPRR